VEAPAAILLENLSKVYDLPPGSAGAAQAVAADNLNLRIAEREVFGLVGPNGAGKTTTLKMICGLLVPTAGRIVVNGVDVERDPEAAQGGIGYLADFFSLYDDLKVWEYLDYFAHAYKMAPETIAGRITDVLRRWDSIPRGASSFGSSCMSSTAGAKRSLSPPISSTTSRRCARPLPLSKRAACSGAAGSSRSLGRASGSAACGSWSLLRGSRLSSGCRAARA